MVRSIAPTRATLPAGYLNFCAIKLYCYCFQIPLLMIQTIVGS